MFILIGEWEGDYGDQYERPVETLAVSSSHEKLVAYWEKNLVDGDFARYAGHRIEEVPNLDGKCDISGHAEGSEACEVYQMGEAHEETICTKCRGTTGPHYIVDKGDGLAIKDEKLCPSCIAAEYPRAVAIQSAHVDYLSHRVGSLEGLLAENPPANILHIKGLVATAMSRIQREEMTDPLLSPIQVRERKKDLETTIHDIYELLRGKGDGVS